jgi:hypothetical protein
MPTPSAAVAELRKGSKSMNNNNAEMPTHGQIERRAYQIFLEHGFHPGNALGDWLAAEKELTEHPERVDAIKIPPDAALIALRKHATA